MSEITVGFEESLRGAQVLDIRMASGVAPGLEADWEKALIDASGIVTARKAGGHIVGLALIYGDFPTIEVNEVLVHRDYRDTTVKQRIVSTIIEQTLTHNKLLDDK